MNAVIRGLADSLRSTLRTSRSVRRRQLASAFPSFAAVDVLEARLLLAADLGDAPDTSAATGPGNYQTIAVNNGPRHTIDQTQNTLFLGAGVDGDIAAQQNTGASGDDLFTAGGRNDEDGILSTSELYATVGTNPVVTLEATNTTGRTATLFGWIDLNRNGVFENATERAQVTVPSGTDHQRVSLTFPLATVGSIGSTYARFRLSTDAASANSTGLASDGEVEDYRFTIRNRIAFPLATRSTITLGQQINQPSENWPLTFLGFDVAPIGDLDQNGVQDFVVTDPLEGGVMQQSNPKGAVYVVFQNPDGTVKQSVKIADGYNGGPSLGFDDMFGLSIAPLGDIDGDGVTDLAIGSPGDSTRGTERGAVYIVRLKPDGTAKNFTKIADSLNGGPVLHDQDGFGMSVASPGDIDGDGIVDLVVAATDADVGGVDRGEIFTMFLKADGTVRSFATIENTSQWNPSIEEEETFGARITPIGDINGDGVQDLAALSASNVTLGEQIESIPKQIDILLMNSDGTLKKFVEIGDELNGGPDFATSDALWDLTSVGDVDADGVEDLAVVVGDFNGEGQSRLMVLTLTPDGRAKSSQQTTSRMRRSSSSPTNLGDTNNDGRIELAWGLPPRWGLRASARNCSD
ncbi:MAG: FG-GAP-like repeat-containing protein [Planctomycetaceae bacterium]